MNTRPYQYREPAPRQHSARPDAIRAFLQELTPKVAGFVHQREPIRSRLRMIGSTPHEFERHCNVINHTARWVTRRNGCDSQNPRRGCFAA